MPVKPIPDLTEVHCDGFAVHDLLRRQDTEIGHIGDQVRHRDHQQRTSHDRRQVSHGILQLFQQIIQVSISVEAPQTGDQRRTEATEVSCITEGCRRREILHGNRGIRRTWRNKNDRKNENGDQKKDFNGCENDWEEGGLFHSCTIDGCAKADEPDSGCFGNRTLTAAVASRYEAGIRLQDSGEITTKSDIPKGN